eukprot:TRINITY_DN13952_c1_g1_i2.p1 TRINITY_DN13952_c1_g1~~TRINITY_DN13952_c1_g1_i2.p1  ORF type:complete len:561 (+),score=255.26 TRINITY_DN13952_c1_g1_i2:103-1785(+)
MPPSDGNNKAADDDTSSEDDAVQRVMSQQSNAIFLDLPGTAEGDGRRVPVADDSPPASPTGRNRQSPRLRAPRGSTTTTKFTMSFGSFAATTSSRQRLTVCNSAARLRRSYVDDGTAARYRQSASASSSPTAKPVADCSFGAERDASTRHPLRRVSAVTMRENLDESVATAGSATSSVHAWVSGAERELRAKVAVAVLPGCVVPSALWAVTVAVPDLVDSTAWRCVGGAVIAVAVAYVLVMLAGLLRSVSEFYASQQIEIEFRKAVEESVASFIPAEFLSLLHYQDVTQVKIGDRQVTDLAIMFTDIRDFTSLSQQESGEAVFDWINRFTGIVVPCIRASGGFIDKYLGDGIMAVFEDPAGGVAAGIAMQRRLDERTDDVSLGGQKVRLGVGLHYGSVVVGTVGDPERIDTTLIGDVVNMASRVEGLTKYYSSRLLITNAVAEQIGLTDSQYLHRSIGRMQVKGSSVAFAVYDVYAADSLEVQIEKQRTAARFAEGVELMRKRRWDDAVAAFVEVGAAAAGGGTAWRDQAAATKIDFCKQYRASGIPYVGWDGEDCWVSK